MSEDVKGPEVLDESGMNRRELVKRGAAVAAGAALSGGLFGGVANARPFIARKRITVSYWTWSWLTALPNVKHDYAKAAFEKANPGVTLDVKLYKYPDYLTALQAAVPASTVGELWQIPTPAAMNQYYRRLQPLEGYIRRDWGKNWRSRFNEAIPNFHGHIVTLPLGLSIGGGLVWYNTALFKKARVKVPQSYQEMKASIPKFKAIGVAPMAWGAKDNWQNVDLLFTFTNQFSAGKDIPHMAEKGQVAFTNQALVKGLTFLNQTIKDGLYQDAPFSTPAFPGAFPDIFGGNKAAMILAGSWNFNVGIGIPGATKTWRTFLFPHINGAPKVNWLGKNPSGVPAGSGKYGSKPLNDHGVPIGISMKKGLRKDKAEAAWEFIRWVDSVKGQTVNASWQEPVVKGAKLTGVPKGFSEQLAWAHSLNNQSVTRNLANNEIVQAIQSAIADVCVNGADPKSALQRVERVAAGIRGPAKG